VGKPHRLQLVKGGRAGDGGDGLVYSGSDGGFIRGFGMAAPGKVSVIYCS
jgi:hypothetical protein